MRTSLLCSVLLVACTTSTRLDAAVAMDAGDAADAGVDAGPPVIVDAGPPDPLCGCTPGDHNARIYVLSQDAELYAFDPETLELELIVGPVCASGGSPYSMAVDPGGRAWVLFSDSRRMQTIDVNDLGACEDSGYLPTEPELPLFGMGFLQRDDGCAELYGMSYSGDGAFSEGPDLGVLARIAGDPPRAMILSATDYDGGELTGTGDGRLFAFTGNDPAKLVEYDPDDGSVVEILPLDGFSKTNASAFAFFGGDLWLFTESLGEGCNECFDASCATAWADCQADETCREAVDCAIEQGDVTDDCGGLAGPDMLMCLDTCSDQCLVSLRARVSQVTRIDWDRSDGPDRARTLEVPRLPIRVVGAGTSPCVPLI